MIVDPEIAIEVEGLTKHFEGRAVVDRLTLQVRRGQIYGFLGPNGSGKTTTIRMLGGLLSPDAGCGTCLGHDIRTGTQAIKRCVGYMTQRFSLYEDLSVRENLEFVARIYGLPDPEVAARSLIERMQLVNRAGQVAGTLSGGWKQRLALAACMLPGPQLLLLDEPTAGVDPMARREFWREIHALAADGLTVLVSTHYMEEAERCHEIAYIASGRLVATGTVDDVIARSRLVTYTVTGERLTELAAEVGRCEGIDTVAPFGASLHVSGRDALAMEAATASWRADPTRTWQRSRSSLEDVFIDLMGRRRDSWNCMPGQSRDRELAARRIPRRGDQSQRRPNGSQARMMSSVSADARPHRPRRGSAVEAIQRTLAGLRYDAAELGWHYRDLCGRFASVLRTGLRRRRGDAGALLSPGLADGMLPSGFIWFAALWQVWLAQMPRPSGFSGRVGAMVRKEVVHLLRDHVTLALMLFFPLSELVLFGYAINTTPHDLPTAVMLQEQSDVGRAILAALQNTRFFKITRQVEDKAEFDRVFASGEVLFAIEVPKGFERALRRGESPPLLLVADATDPVTTGSALAALGPLVQSALQNERAVPPLIAPAFEIRQQSRYNPAGVTQFNIVPGLLGTILAITTLSITALSVTRETERGTMESLLAMPIGPLEIMLGKILPYVVIAFLQAALILAAGVVLFRVPILGDLALLAGLSALFITANLTIGYTLSTLARTQLQAVQMALMFVMPNMMLSGFMFPFAGMPGWAQTIGQCLPLTHFVRMTRAILLKGSTLADMQSDALWLVALMLLTATFAATRFRRTLD